MATYRGESVELDLGLIYGIAESRSVHELESIATQFCGAHEFTRWKYSLVGPDCVLSNYPDSFMNAYLNKRLRVHDPVIKIVLSHRRATAWDVIPLMQVERAKGAPEREILEMRCGAGGRAGVTAPAFDRGGRHYDVALVSFARARALTQVEQRYNEPRVQLFAAYFASVAPAVLLRKQRVEKPAVSLTDRERDCLCWAAKGKSSWEIGQLLNISEPTVKFHLMNTGKKLGAHTRALTITRAIQAGLINP